MEKLSEVILEEVSKKQVGEFKKIKLPQTPNGGEKQKFKKGDKVTTLPSATLIAGLTFTVNQCHCDNGYWHYYGLGVWHRQKDLKLA